MVHFAGSLLGVLVFEMQSWWDDSQVMWYYLYSLIG